MLVTDFTRRELLFRKTRRDLFAMGWEEVGEGGGMLWELYRGKRWDGYQIVDVKIAPGGLSLFVKIEKVA